MSDWNEELRKAYRNYLSEEIARPEVLQAQKKLEASFQPAAAPMFEPAVSLAACFLLALFFFCYEFQAPLREVIRPETRPVMLALNPRPVQDSAKPLDPHRVLVKKISSAAGPTMVYQKKHHDIPITVVWVFPKEAIK